MLCVCIYFDGYSLISCTKWSWQFIRLAEVFINCLDPYAVADLCSVQSQPAACLISHTVVYLLFLNEFFSEMFQSSGYVYHHKEGNLPFSIKYVSLGSVKCSLCLMTSNNLLEKP